MAGLDNVGINATTGGGDWIDDDIRDGGGVVCHVLPCSIDGDSTAPIGRYFRPVPVHRILVHRRSGGGGGGAAHPPPPSSSSSSSSSSSYSPAGGKGDHRADDANGVDPGEDGGGGGGDDVVVAAVVMAAQFRGRGLLCVADDVDDDDGRGKRRRVEDDARGLAIATSAIATGTTRNSPLSELPPDVLGVVFSSSSSSSSSSSYPNHPSSFFSSAEEEGRAIRPIATFRSLWIWNHEHDVKGTTTMDRLIDDGVGGASCGLGAVLGWRDLAREIHDPIPVVLP